MKRILSAALLATLALPLGCATILAPKTNPLPINSAPDKADVYIDGVKRGTTPLTLELDPRRSYTLVFKKEGLEDKVFEVRNKVGVGWVVLDILFGLVPVIVDAGTGAWHSLDAETVRVSWLPPEPPATGPGAVNCNLSGTEAWKNASAVEKKRMLDECRQQAAQPAAETQS
ncbi:PEGA domain-containing protein [Pyxidicoccus trucidator]|uniref:PEGA domain-containing protein n=1 Tax=Pyxidicoccus trucidator TaxID=2709662 RepID=UPI0013D9F1BC|nr:PEGA domain-containing protein [Pyxidicoccus trucidator]